MPIPQSMHSIDVPAPGGPEALVLVTRPVPRPAAGEVLIRVNAVGLNRADLMQRQGHYPPPPGASPILGMEVSGHIAAVGDPLEGSTLRWQVGDPVCALLAGGGYAEYCVAPAGQCLPIPKGISLTDAAAIPEAAVTIWANLFETGRLLPGDLFLVQGGSSGIGSFAIQVARCFGARVVTTAGSEEKCRFAVGMGAEKAVNYREGDWAAEIAAWSRPHGIDVILDMVGGDYFARHLDLLATGGRLVQIAFARGSQVTVDLRTLITKRLIVTGSTLRSRPVAEKSALVAAVEQKLWPLFEEGRLHAVVSDRFPLAQAAEAHRRMEEGGHMGKIVLEVPES